MQGALPISPEHTLRRFVTLDPRPLPRWAKWTGSSEVDRSFVGTHIHSEHAHALLFESLLIDPRAAPVASFGDALASPTTTPDGSMVFMSAALWSDFCDHLRNTPETGTYHLNRRVRGMAGARGVWTLPDGRALAIIATPELSRGLIAIMNPEMPSQVTLPTYTTSKGSQPGKVLITVSAYTGARHILYTSWEAA